MSDILTKPVARIVRQVANQNSGFLSTDMRSVICNFCDQAANDWESMVHTEDCIVRTAQLAHDKHLLAKEKADQGK